IHRRAAHEAAGKGPGAVVMPGMPQGRDIGEAGTKSVSLVTILDDRSIHIDERPVSIAEFQRIEIDLDGVSHWYEVVERIERSLGPASDASGSDQLIARIHLTGSSAIPSALAWSIRRDRDLLLAEAENRASGIGQCWIDRVELGEFQSAGAQGH